MRRRRPPHYVEPGGPLYFPSPEAYDDEGLVAVGGDLSVPRLLLAYDSGIFPWYDEGLPPLWWSPNPRAIIEPAALHVSRSMQRVIRHGTFRVTWNRAFGAVMRGCADREEGTWILPELLEAYSELHRLGHAHSLEVWQGPDLVGGLYGVQRGGLFAAESMFHRATNASKLALIATLRALASRGIELFDTQLSTPHLVSLGATAIPRREYLARLARARHLDVHLDGLDPAAFLLEDQS
ncbi:MAG: leucyl/phenylalanyl-tRNA--protein transferase [Polyangiaceae bacterium]|nr:leucyl/phenylalanyl-tRNA--protein transferase [Polyangiaceae bacterium]MCL4750832.1 leucyl/phenylalanyl-tRNA--protein transferase [Myxococcales bacterium]